ncbi:MAG: ribonucleoside-diphosphate reductase, adenosylcobalamin-dependent [Dehalococcoides mccartyi]|uniref:adenosylcobalamin-dependent ribonucleoside-diphosphate reductase n=1 Tax=Dehalococcoides mccartyi TaxID=61435 RepID=UPI00080508F8|nr:adenosylcobalamin-dependent ribonucleoside-diphosphate reductase [Dehalococcoides mccartyi]OBW62916.1 MAG: ribonucleoside-diphosphate reductase, adenosylcobalamin-dependent [Dehalococcoides mccartyi]
MKLSGNAKIVLEKRYLKRDGDGSITESPEDMFRRVADAVAAAENAYNQQGKAACWADEFYRMMTGLEFLPNSPTLLNAGRELGLLSSCFVLPVEDSVEGIAKAIGEAMIIHQYGGGTGFAFDTIRPEDTPIKSGHNVAGGPVRLVGVFSEAANYIKQAGVRCGCNSASLPVNHPDILKFIRAKDEGDHSANFGINIALTDSFIQKVRRGEDYELINPRTGEVTGSLSASDVFYRIAQSAWETGDPGIMFIDRINKDNPTPQLGEFVTTDPCGGQPLLPYESATLGTINLSLMALKEGNCFGVDYLRLGKLIAKAIRFLDDVLEVNRYPIPEVERAAKATRKIGLGFMGFAEMLIKLGIRYDSEQAVSLADRLMTFVNETVNKTSEELALERGSFPAFAGSIYAKSGAKPRRNATCLTFTNTGTTSIIADTSVGIHPIYSLVMVRNILDGQRLLDINHTFEETARERGFFNPVLIEKLLTGESPQNCPEIPRDYRRLLVTARDIQPEWCIRVQAAFQKHTDNAISQTVNFPKSATVEDIAELFLKSHELGLKGVTAYRDSSRDVQVLCTGTDCRDIAKQYFEDCHV